MLQFAVDLEFRYFQRSTTLSVGPFLLLFCRQKLDVWVIFDLSSQNHFCRLSALSDFMVLTPQPQKIQKEKRAREILSGCMGGKNKTTSFCWSDAKIKLISVKWFWPWSNQLCVWRACFLSTKLPPLHAWLLQINHWPKIYFYRALSCCPQMA